ncbi:hypothetical protein P7H60_07670 [Vagococcus carniphilus]|uniref:hypothetical protein n=1 Tax=Vagococcus carniphilus TaxID=218144 RepID=UPI002891F4BA|nr:hypothetical protein [Vagococcus carniphilus]MDT2831904.1 hypothetical protein [Vagococcus carniphilus]MDT2839288.1 hypothetical protein [Vagococcus carniphilus]MDT2849040.1 hypothetical protein [Vagococcus carniphilus]MDT2855414.1 hypothetical protein [Vagococcus carniphilus]
MAEAIVICLFLIILIFLQIKEQRNIIIFSETSKIKRSLSIILSLSILVIFWQPLLYNQIKLIAFAALILFIGFTKEGLGKSSLIKFGLLTGKFEDYQTIQIEETKTGKTFVSFYRKKNNRSSMLFKVSVEELENYFEEQSFEGELIIGNISDTKMIH